MFLALNGIFEPSAIQQLPDGRFLIVEDEKSHPLSLLTIHPDGTTSHIPLTTISGAEAVKLDDLEGLTADSAGFIYAITSHSRNSSGEQKKSREKLVRFGIAGNSAVSPVVVTGVRAALISAHPVLAKAAAVLDVKGDGGINIEALEVTPDNARLLIGFRSPLLGERAIIAAIENPRAVFESGAAPRIAPQLVTLDLGGHGIRGMSYVPALSGYLVISGAVGKDPQQNRLWFWNGADQEPARRISVAGLAGFEHAEGVCGAIIDGKPKIVIVSDDGSREQARPARFLVLDPEQLSGSTPQAGSSK